MKNPDPRAIRYPGVSPAKLGFTIIITPIKPNKTAIIRLTPRGRSPNNRGDKVVTISGEINTTEIASAMWIK